MSLRFVKNTYFQAVKNTNNKDHYNINKDICQRILLFQSLLTKFVLFKLKNITLLPVEQFGNMNLYHQTVLLKIIYGIISFMKKQKLLISKKTPFKYVFSIAIMHSCGTVVWVNVCLYQRMVAVRNYSTNTIVEKSKQRGKGGED